MKFNRIFLILAGLVVISSLRAELTWVTDFPAAQKQAANEGKLLLIEFTGSDWCFYCQKLENEVFVTAAFEQFAHRYVLVRLDFPQNKNLPAAEKAQNEILQAQFKIEGFPTVVLCDASGHEMRRAPGYDPDRGPKTYLNELFGSR